MATIIADGKSFEAPDGTKLNTAIEQIGGIDILHRCGGKAKCTTCRITFNSGEPDDFHPREKEKLEDKGDLGEYRLSCHILCEGTMDVNVLQTVTNTGLDDPGPELTPEIPEEV